VSRSSYVYFVIESMPSSIEPVAGFTVKHELLTWLRQQKHTDALLVYRMPDNPTGYYAQVGRTGARVVDITSEVLP
jgi:hypothetical protein